jgi:hypothetical protein
MDKSKTSLDIIMMNKLKKFEEYPRLDGKYNEGACIIDIKPDKVKFIFKDIKAKFITFHKSFCKLESTLKIYKKLDDDFDDNLCFVGFNNEEYYIFNDFDGTYVFYIPLSDILDKKLLSKI